MKTRLSKTCLGISAAFLLCAAPAAAQDAVDVDAAKAGIVPSRDVAVGAYTGLFDGYNRGGLLGIQARYRLGLFEAGGFAEVGTEAFTHYAGFGATAGLAWRTSFGLRLAASGALGLHAYENVGARFLSADPGADGTTPFAGARVGASYIFGRRQNHVELGLMGVYEGDLTRSTVTTYYTQEDWFDDTPRAMTSTHTLGTHRFGALVTVGWTRDLF
ncbi:hypothetical protein [Polyangium fumosum]|uniref:Outer membrane protein beta-barrel domain-containing protein n=1 Tax=Polyangium fumosum TaxID=889272 RepID=A0A4V5PKK3_9BACT|nr:hypothetical protein [Polyangium fumosum]TKC95861.1 hypothetical protein E8A74_46025 [Polyangium fumosum]